MSTTLRKVDLSGDRKVTRKTVDQLHAGGFHHLADLAEQYIDDRPGLLRRTWKRLAS